MSEAVITTVSLIAAYLIGSIPIAYLVGRLRKGIDLRQVGSRNLGAMNVFYSVGFAEGLAVLAIDISKGAAAVALARWLGASLVVEFLAGALVVLGHQFPVFFKFHGGRGGASCIGILVFFMPWGILIYLGLFGLLLLITRFPTLSYSIAFLSFPFIGWLLYGHWEFAAYTVGLLLLPGLKYIPRIKEMRLKGGGWGHVFMRRGLKDRL